MHSRRMELSTSTTTAEQRVPTRTVVALTMSSSRSSADRNRHRRSGMRVVRHRMDGVAGATVAAGLALLHRSATPIVARSELVAIEGEGGGEKMLHGLAHIIAQELLHGDANTGAEVLTYAVGAAGTGKTATLLGNVHPLPSSSSLEISTPQRRGLLAAVVEELLAQDAVRSVALSVVEVGQATLPPRLASRDRRHRAVDLLSGLCDGNDDEHETDVPSSATISSQLPRSRCGCFMDDGADIPATRYVCCQSLLEVEEVVAEALSHAQTWTAHANVNEEHGQDDEKMMWVRPRAASPEHISHILMTLLVRGEVGCGVWKLWDLCGPQVEGVEHKDASSYAQHIFAHLTESSPCLDGGASSSSPSSSPMNDVGADEVVVDLIDSTRRRSCSLLTLVAATRSDHCYDSANAAVLSTAVKMMARREGVEERSIASASSRATRRAENMFAASRVLDHFVLPFHQLHRCNTNSPPRPSSSSSATATATRPLTLTAPPPPPPAHAPPHKMMEVCANGMDGPLSINVSYDRGTPTTDSPAAQPTTEVLKMMNGDESSHVVSVGGSRGLHPEQVEQRCSPHPIHNEHREEAAGEDHGEDDDDDDVSPPPHLASPDTPPHLPQTGDPKAHERAPRTITGSTPKQLFPDHADVCDGDDDGAAHSSVLAKMVEPFVEESRQLLRVLEMRVDQWLVMERASMQRLQHMWENNAEEVRQLHQMMKACGHELGAHTPHNNNNNNTSMASSSSQELPPLQRALQVEQRIVAVEQQLLAWKRRQPPSLAAIVSETHRLLSSVLQRMLQRCGEAFAAAHRDAARAKEQCRDEHQRCLRYAHYVSELEEDLNRVLPHPATSSFSPPPPSSSSIHPDEVPHQRHQHAHDESPPRPYPNDDVELLDEMPTPISPRSSSTQSLPSLWPSSSFGVADANTMHRMQHLLARATMTGDGGDAMMMRGDARPEELFEVCSLGGGEGQTPVRHQRRLHDGPIHSSEVSRATPPSSSKPTMMEEEERFPPAEVMELRAAVAAMQYVAASMLPGEDHHRFAISPRGEEVLTLASIGAAEEMRCGSPCGSDMLAALRRLQQASTAVEHRLRLASEAERGCLTALVYRDA